VSDNLKEIVNKYIKAIYITEDAQSIKFETDHEYYLYKSEGDCCACIYFEDIEYPARKPENGYLVKSIHLVDKYGYRITTDVGDIVISGRYDSASGWGGYDVHCELWGIIPKDLEGCKWKEFKD
jgi:hypothetical protein